MFARCGRWCTVLALVACDPAPPPVHNAAPPTPARRNVHTRTDLGTWRWKALPQHGVVWELGLESGSGTRIVLDRDAGQLSQWDVRDDGSVAPPVTKSLAHGDVDRLWQMAEVVWSSPEPPEYRHVADSSETFLALDGDQVMILEYSGPIPDDHPASVLAVALRRAAGLRW